MLNRFIEEKLEHALTTNQNLANLQPTGLMPLNPNLCQKTLQSLANLPRADSGSAADFQRSDEAKAKQWLFDKSREDASKWDNAEIAQFNLALEVLTSNVLANHGRSDNTRKSLKQNWQAFVTYCLEAKLSPLPSSSEVIKKYLKHLVSQRPYDELEFKKVVQSTQDDLDVIKLSTIKMRLWAIGTIHTEIGLLNPISDPTIVRFVDQIARQRTQLHGERKQASAFRAKDLNLLVPLYRQGSRVQKRDLALLAVSLCSMLRESELSALEFRDVQFRSDGSAQLQIRATKTSTNGEIAYTVLPTNVMHLVSEYMQVIGLSWNDPKIYSPGEYLFRKAINPNASPARIEKRSKILKPLSNVTIDKIFAAAHKTLTLHYPHLYSSIRKWSGHSARVGGLHDLILESKEDISVIMLNGRWKRADMPVYYGRRIQQDSIGLASLVGAFSFE